MYKVIQHWYEWVTLLINAGGSNACLLHFLHYGLEIIVLYVLDVL